jgi:hypothetical protein
MIPFFRKIRKKMADDNKPIKYMRYAIGEILLVVIGILIALSINNWNELRKAKIVEQSYLIRLSTELRNDKKLLLFSRELSKIRMDQIHLLNEVILNPNLSIEEPYEIIESIEKVTWLSYLPIARIVYNDLLNSGNMSLIQSEKIRNQLAIYYGDIEGWESILSAKSAQIEFTAATAGLLSIEMLTAVENSESNDPTKSKNLELEISEKDLKKIISELSSNNDAIKWLPQIYHYHVLSDKVIDQFIVNVDSLLKLIEEELQIKTKE